MNHDPRAPVLVGAGQVLQRLDSDVEGLDPLGLMEEAARRAAFDARCPALLARLDSIRVPKGLWPYENPAHALRVPARQPAPKAFTPSAMDSSGMSPAIILRANI